MITAIRRELVKDLLGIAKAREEWNSIGGAKDAQTMRDVAKILGLNPDDYTPEFWMRLYNHEFESGISKFKFVVPSLGEFISGPDEYGYYMYANGECVHCSKPSDTACHRGEALA